MVGKHLLVGMKIAIPVLPSMALYTSDDTRLCVNDDCFEVISQPLQIANFSQKKDRYRGPACDVLSSKYGGLL